MVIIKNLQKTYGHGSAAIKALKGVNLEVEDGEFVAIMGRSGSGKSTLLRIIGLLDPPTGGEVMIDGVAALKLPEREKARFRLQKLGYIFQEYSLIAELTLLENVYLPSLAEFEGTDYRKRASELLEIVGLQDRASHYPSEVSGGEQQRAAIARALINQPHTLLADEPTASLDIDSAKIVLDLFLKLNKELEQTIIMVTHEPDDRQYVNRALVMKNGLFEE